MCFSEKIRGGKKTEKSPPHFFPPFIYFLLVLPISNVETLILTKCTQRCTIACFESGGRRPVKPI